MGRADSGARRPPTDRPDMPASTASPDPTKTNAAAPAKGRTKRAAKAAAPSPEAIELLAAVSERDSERVASLALLAPPEAVLPALLRALALRRGPGARELGPLVEALIDALPDPTLADERGRTPLMAAAAAGDVETLHRLLPRSEAKAADQDGLTALMRAAHTGTLDAVKALAGASDPDAQDAEGHTALAWAIASESTDRAVFLAKRTSEGLHAAIGLALHRAGALLEAAAEAELAQQKREASEAKVLGGVKSPKAAARGARADANTPALRAPRGRPSSRLAMALAAGKITKEAQRWIDVADAAGEHAPLRGLATLIEGWGKTLLPRTRKRVDAASEDRAAARAAKSAAGEQVSERAEAPEDGNTAS